MKESQLNQKKNNPNTIDVGHEMADLLLRLAELGPVVILTKEVKDLMRKLPHDWEDAVTREAAGCDPISLGC